MQSKFLKIILIVVVVLTALASLTYFTRMMVDVGCARTEITEDSFRRKFVGINCWYWERSYQFQENVSIKFI